MIGPKTGRLGEYHRRFIELLAPLENIFEEIAMGTFVNRLKAEIRVELRIIGPNTLGRTMDLAQMIEEKLVIAYNTRLLFNKTHHLSASINSF